MVELLEAKRYIKAVLAADTALVAIVGTRIYDRQVPVGVGVPVVVFQDMANTMQYAAGGYNAGSAGRIVGDFKFLIKGIDETDTEVGNLEAIANRLDQLFSSTSGTTAVARVVTRIEEWFDLTEPSGNTVQYKHLGPYVRVHVSSL
jgi:hypothetical protein